MTEPAAPASSTKYEEFPTDPAGLAPASPPAVIRFGSGDRFPFGIGPVAKRIGQFDGWLSTTSGCMGQA